MLTEEENLMNLKQCPRFEFCSINRCPFDFFVAERSELPEEERCLYWKILGNPRTSRMFKGKISRQMRGMVLNVRDKWKKERLEFK